MKLNRFFSVILCAALFSANIGFAAEGWRSYVPTWEGARTALQGARESMPTWEGTRQAAGNMWEGSAGQKMWQSRPNITKGVSDFVSQNKNLVIGALIAAIGLTALISHLDGFNRFLDEEYRSNPFWQEQYEKNPKSVLAQAYMDYVSSRAKTILPERLGGKPIKKSTGKPMEYETAPILMPTIEFEQPEAFNMPAKKSVPLQPLQGQKGNVGGITYRPLTAEQEDEGS